MDYIKDLPDPKKTNYEVFNSKLEKFYPITFFGFLSHDQNVIRN